MKSIIAISACLFELSAAARLARKRREASKAFSAKGSYHMRVQISSGGCQALEAGWGQVHRLAQNGVYETDPEWVWHVEEDLEAGDKTHSDEQFFDIWGPSEQAVRDRAREKCGAVPETMSTSHEVVPANTETRCLICSGDSSNRIDVVFMGDGYTSGERTRFFEDMQRLTDEMFAGETFRSYLPVFNIWAIHVPSVESGIGYNGRSKNTPFGLYKQGTQHRGVFPSSSGSQRARETCRLADGCDYPSIIGNDEYYGGLGGEFVIGTRSKTTGTVVLRHEMGHNFVRVGEEYDGGSVYSGVNSDSSLWNIKWKHWLTEPNKTLREERQRLPLQEYPWVDLARGARSFSFSSDGSYARWLLKFTVSGCPEEGSVKVFLDGKALPWRPTKPVGAERPDGSTVDRQFYTFEGTTLSSGSHTVRFESGFSPGWGEPIRQLCSLTLHEFGNDAQFANAPGYVGAYPTWNSRGGKTYRPMNDQCLMRTMESTVFCPVCKEGMWHQFLARMSLIDGVDVNDSDKANVAVQLNAVPLAQFREQAVPGLTESFSVVWLKGGRQQSQLTDKFYFTGSANELQGSWQVQLTYRTSEVRADPNGLLSDTKSFSISGGGSPSPTPPSPSPPSPTPPSPTPPSPTPPSPTPPTGGCVQEKDCNVSAWCSSDLQAWCQANAATCPAPYCKRT